MTQTKRVFEIKAERGDGTKFRIYFDDGQYCLEYRNDTLGVRDWGSGDDSLEKSVWVPLGYQANFADILAEFFDELSNYEAIEGADE